MMNDQEQFLLNCITRKDALRMKFDNPDFLAKDRRNSSHSSKMDVTVYSIFNVV